MRISALRPAALTLAALTVIASRPAHAGQEIYSRQIQISSGLYLGLKRDQAQQGTVTVKTQGGKELGKLDYAGSFVPIEAKGTYCLEFNQPTFNLNFAIVKSRESTGAYFLNLSRDASKVLKAKGGWEGTVEGTVTLHEKEGQALLVLQ
ncbi:MAG: hypothetical protein ABSH53_02040 [Holophaga sp.]|jgi:hypothetical protein